MNLTLFGMNLNDVTHNDVYTHLIFMKFKMRIYKGQRTEIHRMEVHRLLLMKEKDGYCVTVILTFKRLPISIGFEPVRKQLFSENRIKIGESSIRMEFCSLTDRHKHV